MSLEVSATFEEALVKISQNRCEEEFVPFHCPLLGDFVSRILTIDFGNLGIMPFGDAASVRYYVLQDVYETKSFSRPSKFRRASSLPLAYNREPCYNKTVKSLGSIKLQIKKNGALSRSYSFSALIMSCCS